MKLSKETKVGLLAVVSLIVVYLGLNFLRGETVLSSSNKYYTIYDHCKGLGVSSPVLLNGVPVGRVRSMKVMPDKQYRVLVTFETQKEIKLTDATQALLVSSSLLGEKAISLLVGDGNQLKSHDMVLGHVEQSLGDILAQDKLPAMQQDFKHISLLINQFISNLVENTGRFDAIFSNLEEMTDHLKQIVADNKTKFHVMTDGFSEVAQILVDQERGLLPLVTRGNQLLQAVKSEQMTGFVEKFDHVLRSLSEVLEAVTQEGSSIGKLLRSDSLHSDLNRTFRSLDELLIDLKQHPWHYVHFSLFNRRHRRSRAKLDKKIATSAEE